MRYFGYNVCLLGNRLVLRSFKLETLKFDSQLLSWLTSKLLLRIALFWVMTQRGSGNSLQTFRDKLYVPKRR